ncbi:MAG: TonB-dependent receptor [Acidobacteria bacterium]|nr:TonB-dependent receptor [Acidobacteriota bacterium]
MARTKFIIWSLVFFLWPVAVFSQVTGSLRGTVRDETGAVLAQARVGVQGTALRYETTTSAEGVYYFNLLPPGTYEVVAERSGFSSLTYSGVPLAVNQKVVLDFTLKIRELEETIEVDAAASDIEVARADISSRVNQRTIAALPLNGRNFEDLIALVPGAKPEPAASQASRVSIFGERGAAISFVVDGADNNDAVSGGPLQHFTQDSIQEFEVITTGQEAEFGRAQGGVANIITRSGGNQWTGSSFLFGRNDSLDSSNVKSQKVPRLHRRQWGLTAGGPIRHDAAFFFGSFEVLDEDRGVNIDRSRIPAFILSGIATPSSREDFTIGPRTEGFRGLFRIDHHVNQSHRLHGLFSRSRDDVSGEISSPIAGTIALPSAARTEKQESTALTLRETWSLNGDTFLETSFKWVDAQNGSNLERHNRLEPILLLLRTGFIQVGAPFGGKNRRDSQYAQFAQRLARYQLGRSGEHQLRFGWDWNRVGLSGFNEITNDVEYSAAFLNPNAAEIMRERFQQLGFAQSAARFFTLSANPGGNLSLDMHNHDLGFFLQDSWRIRPDVTLNLGLRYDYASLFDRDKDNFAPRAGLAWDVGGNHKTVVRLGWGLYYDRNLLAAAATVPELGGVFTRSAFDVALPRLGFDYTDSLIDLVITSGFPTPDGKRGPAENPSYVAFAEALRKNPFALYELLGINVTNLSAPPIITADNIQQFSGLTPQQAIERLEKTFPGTDWEFFDVPGGSLVGNRVLSFFPRGPLELTREISKFSEARTPWTRAFNIGVEQQLVKDLVLSVSYIHRRSRDLLTRRVVNLFDVRPGHPQFGRTVDGGPRINQVTYDGLINYDGLLLELRKQFSQWYGFHASYTGSRARDNLLTGNVGSTFSNNNHPELDYGPSNQSAPHIFVFKGIADLPWDFRLSSILTWRSGNAFNPRGITDQDGDGLVDQRDTSQSRNTFRTQPFFEVDFRVEKTWHLSEKHSLSVLAEAFNLTNRANVRNVNSVSGPAFGTPNNFFAGREIQLGIRYTFGNTRF